MDLDYPSEKKHDLSREVNKMDRRFGSIILSNPKIQLPKKKIPSWIKNKIMHFLKNDQHSHLLHFMEKEAINVRDQIQEDSSGWNIIHFSTKLDASKSLENLLKYVYQEQPKNYQEIIESKTIQGDTPLLIACRFSSNQVIKVLLELGGVDIYSANIKKLTPYQIAFSDNNEEALRLLMRYELLIKQKNQLNIDKLKNEYEKQGQNTCSSILHCLNCLFLCLGIEKNIKQTKEQVKQNETQTDRKMVGKKSEGERKPFGMPQISWLLPQSVFQRKINLFSSLSSPFSIKQGNVVVSHLLIIFQWLAYYPQLLKNIIYQNADKYQVHLFINQKKKILYLDSLFPFYTQSKQPLFLTLNDQLWPMILQKALSQHYNGFFEPGKIPVQDILETITGNIAFKIKMETLLNEDTYSNLLNNLLDKFQQENCIHIVKPSQFCPFKTEQGRIQCFSILKRIGNQYLINCPFRCNQARERQSRQTKELKMHKVHYMNTTTMPVWVEEDEIFLFFQEIVFCHSFNPSKFINTQKLHFVETKQSQDHRFYIRIKIPKIKKIKQNNLMEQNDKIVIGIKTKLNLQEKYTDLQKCQESKEQKMITSQHSISIKKCDGWSLFNQKGKNNISQQKQTLQKINSEGQGVVVINFQELPNEIILQCNLDKYIQNGIGPIEQISLYVKSEFKLQMQIMETFIGDLEFIQCCKSYFNTNHHMYQYPLVQKIGDYALILAPEKEQCFLQLKESLNQDDIIQGCLTQNGYRLDLLDFEDIHYAIIAHNQSQFIENISIFKAKQAETVESQINGQIRE